MSKSLGNVIRPRELVDTYGVDTVRYFVLREMSFGLDSSFSSEAILARHNADLANDLGNLFSRSLTMIDKYAAGRVPEVVTADSADLSKRVNKNHEVEIIGRDYDKLKAIQEKIPQITIKELEENEDTTGKNIIFCVKPYALQSVSARLIGTANIIIYFSRNKT